MAGNEVERDHVSGRPRNLVDRLRATGGKGQCGPLKAEAADRIEALEAEVSALEQIASLTNETRRALYKRFQARAQSAEHAGKDR